MPMSSMTDPERIRYLEDYQTIGETMVGAMVLALSDPTKSKADCFAEFEFWRGKLQKLHAVRVEELQVVTAQNTAR